MAISNTETELILAGIEPPIDSILIDGQLVDFTAYDGSLESTTVGTEYSLAMEGFNDIDAAFSDNTGVTQSLSVNIQNAGSGVYPIVVFLPSDLSSPVYSGNATITNDVMVVEIPDVSAGSPVVGMWLGSDYPNTGGAFYGVAG